MICTVEECGKTVLARGYCANHYKQWRRNGSVNRLNRKSPSTYRTIGDTTYIGLYDMKGNVYAEAMIDTEDLDKVRPYKWSRHGDYIGAYDKSLERVIYLQRLIMDCPDDMVVNHWDRNKLNYKKANLSICTTTDNNSYRAKTVGKYPYKGIYYMKNTRAKRKWVARFKYEGVSIRISSLNDMEEAAWVYDQIAMQVAGKYAHTNFKWDNQGNNYVME